VKTRERGTTSRGVRFARSVVAVGIAALIGVAAEIAYKAWIGALPAGDYVLLCAAITIGCGLAVGAIVGAIGGGYGLALGIWAGLFVGLEIGHTPLRGALVALGCIVATWGIIRAFEGGRLSEAIGAGASVAAAVFLPITAFPVFLILLGLDGRGVLFLIAKVIVFALALAALLALTNRLGNASKVLHATVGVGTLLVLVAAAGFLSPPRNQPSVFTGGKVEKVRDADPDAPAIFLLILDTVRADHLSIYGYERDTTPGLRDFAATHERTAVFPFAFSTASWTLPSHASLFTGEVVSVHRAGATRRALESLRTGRRSRGMQAERTLAEVALSHGYETSAVFANTVLSLDRGLQRGFDFYQLLTPPDELDLVGEHVRRTLAPVLMAHSIPPHPNAYVINDAVLDRLDTCGGKPCFVVANYMDAHGPYLPPPSVAGTFTEGMKGKPPLRARMDLPEGGLEWAMSRYDEQILALDGAITALLGELEARGVLDRSWVIITSDHGEAFGEHGVVRHGTSIYNEQVRIPLIIHPPKGVAIERTDQPVSLIDITATLSSIVSGSTLGTGQDLRDPSERSSPVQIELFGYFRDAKPEMLGTLFDKRARAVVSGDRKLIEYEGGLVALHSLSGDPREESNLAESEGGEVDLLTPQLPPLRASASDASTEEAPSLTPAEIEQLRALGYL